MKLNIQKTAEHSGTVSQRGGGVVIARGIKKVTERVDSEGNVIDPRTKKVIKKI
jgi:hypothetical protein